jgi:hypothetical protein
MHYRVFESKGALVRLNGFPFNIHVTSSHSFCDIFIIRSLLLSNHLKNIWMGFTNIQQIRSKNL